MKIHKQIYKIGVFGVQVNTTLCGRVRVKTSPDGYYNSTTWDKQVTCKFCLKKLKEKR